MKAARLLSELTLLQAHGRLSTQQLAERLSISRRTAHRDMEALCFAGVPLVAFRGAQGGWEIEKGWRTKVPGLDEAELRALLMAQPSTLGDPRLIAAAERAFSKLMAAMPSSMRTQAASIRSRMHIDTTGWHGASDNLSMLPTVQDAVARNRKLAFLYKRGDGNTATRSVNPLGTVCKQTVWYLVAQVPAGMRTYRISRMSGAVIESESFERPPDFDLAAWWQSAKAQLAIARNQFSATLALTPEAAASIGRWCQVSPASHPQTLHGFLALDVQFESREQARFIALGLGAGARVLSPQDLADEIAAEIGRISGTCTSAVYARI